MKKVVMLLSLLLLLTSMIPIVSADLTGYVPAPYLSSWELTFNYPWRLFHVGGVGNRFVLRPTVINVGTFDLSDAKIKIVINKVWIRDGDVWTGPFTDAATVDSNVKVLNGEKIGPKTYTVSLGTIKVDRSKDAFFNFWAVEGVYYQFVVSVWYLP